ncbi:signal recognition particle-docking protein FtsY [Candidatus Bathyarchaeota archaeon]|nr:signal recognition particle-docking protein FtsY [Candidatus Bathyarchaeota archaeon]MBS7630075.1 signal recognition particle-docking protein FtsY [Candidatus Bathyarchaeota archaeon]
MFERLKQGIKNVVEKISKSEFSTKDLESILDEFKLQLIANDVAVDVAEKICEKIKENLINKPHPRFENKTSLVRDTLKESIKSIMTAETDIDILKLAALHKTLRKPLVIMFVGINGTGKTTTIAKVARLMLKNGFGVVLASADTYRAGAIEQIEEHAKRLGIRVIKHDYGADPAAVAYDAVRHAEARGIDVVLVDTAGRMQTNRNLMDELKKIKRVIQPELTIMVVDALIGNDAVQQAETFSSALGFDASILTKVDADVKGGSSLSIPFVTGKPIIYIGIGQSYDDLHKFDPEWFSEKLISGQ